MQRQLLVVLLALLSACAREDPAELTDAGSESTSTWRAVINLPAVELPVELFLAEDGSEAWFRNGKEIVNVPQIENEGRLWRLNFPAFNNTLLLEKSEFELSGNLTLVKRGYQQVMSLTATPYNGYRFVSTPVPEIDVTGRWAVTFTDDEGKQTTAVGEFDQQGAKLTGTFLTPLGDYRYLAGEVDGRQLMLSTFDGAHAFVFSAAGQEDGSLEGDFWSGTRWHESWTARRDFDARLPDAYSLTFLKEGYDSLDFSFPDLEGHPVSLQDEKYKSKVVLVSLAGTWCPNCADEMEFLADVYREHRARGLEIVSLLFEHFDDFATAAAQGRALVAEHGIDFEVLVAGSSDKTRAGEALPMLNKVLAFPTLIFIDRNGTVRQIHTGFSGPGTGQYFDEFKKEFAKLLDELLNEKATGSA